MPRRPVHGKVGTVLHDGTGISAGLDGPLAATRYHSLHVPRDSVPDEPVVTARSPDDVVMGIDHRRRPTIGVQFHPENFGSLHGQAMVVNFLEIADRFRRGAGRG